jgi:hypothetical protein
LEPAASLKFAAEYAPLAARFINRHFHVTNFCSWEFSSNCASYLVGEILSQQLGTRVLERQENNVAAR